MLAKGWCSGHYKQFRSGREMHSLRTKHGRHDSPAYVSWTDMKQRCLNPNRDNYPYYGGRGISIDPRWLGVDGFVHFLEDMGERPEGTSLDRIDPDGDYTPENCRWATRNEQMRHHRRNARGRYRRAA